MSNEKELFLLIKNSDHKAFEILFRLYYVPLKKFAKHILEDDDSAEDIVQEVFIRLWENRKSLENSAPGSYLYRIVKNKALNLIRHNTVKLRHVEEVLKASDNFYESEFEQSDIQTMISQSIDKLPEQCKRIFKKSRMEGLKHQEIADELNISVKTVKNQIGKALKILRDDLKDVNTILLILVLQSISEKF